MTRPFRIRRPWLSYAAIAASLLLFAGALLLLLFPLFPQIDARLLAALAGLGFTIVSFFLRSLETESQSRKQHTIKVLFDTRLSAEFRRLLELRRTHFPLERMIDAARFRAYLSATRSADLSEEEAESRNRSAEALRSLLNYYEFIAFGIVTGDLDERLLKGTIRSIMCHLVQDARLVILDFQADSPTHYEHLVWLYDRWREDRFAPVDAAPPEGDASPPAANV